jgi:DNA-binding response OmpR family regulator
MQSPDHEFPAEDDAPHAGDHGKPRVAALEDDPTIRNLLKRLLEPEFSMSFPASGTLLSDAIQNGKVDLVLLDILLPGEDGISIARSIRARSDIPVILLSGLSSSETIATGLNVGADDYVTKPFQANVLRARIRSALRRARASGSAAAAAAAAASDHANQTQFTAIGNARIDLWSRVASNAAGDSATLTEKELQILMALAHHPETVVNRDTLSLLVSGQEWSPINRSLDVHISHLRKKLSGLTGIPKLITSSRGIGYALRVDRCDAA